MNGSLVMKFSDVGFDLLKEYRTDFYIKVFRQLRRQPIIGMQQPTPNGGMLGFQTHLSVRKYGLPLCCDFELRLDDGLLQADRTNNDGHCIIHVPLFHSSPKIYELILFDQNVMDVLDG